MSHEPETPESEFVRKWRHDGNATMIQAVQIIATLTAERDALRTALEEVQIRARIMSVPVVDCGEEVLCDVFLQIANLAREALGGKS